MATDFATLAALPDDRIDVLRGALLVAKDEYPTLDLGEAALALDVLAAPLGRLDAFSPADQATILAEHLFSECGFGGNHHDYYDPRNSFINVVLERKVGIPITLSIVYTEVARRCGIHASGVGFPKHFLVRIETELGEPLIVDPFGGGRIVGRETLESWIDPTRRGPRSLRSLVAPASPRTILLRLLANLKGVYATRGELSRLLVVISRMLELSPDSADDLRDRGFVAMRLGAPRVAEGDFRRYLDLCPEAGDVPEVRRLLSKLSLARPDVN